MTSPHFAWLPPEINSALIFAGPGAAPLLAAAAAWDGLAEDLASSASSFFAVTSDLANGSWQGASAAAMMTVATQYVSWLSTAAAQAEAAASQASAIAGAFEAALAATVQPAVVAANRALVQALAATNWFGLNAPAIMDTEAAYEQMWAADVAAMFGYHADASTAVSQLAPWQQVLSSLGINFGNSPGSLNLGIGNSGLLNIGGGNSGISNLGLGNQGNNNVGFGNTGNNDFGFGLTGNNQIGFGGFNSGSGNIGLFNSGNNNIGFFNSGSGNIGIGNSGSLNTGFANSGTLNTGYFNTGASNLGFMQTGVQDPTAAGLGSQDTSLLSGGHSGTAALAPAGVSSSLLNTANASTGGLNAAMANSALPNPAATPAFAGPAESFNAGAMGVDPAASNAISAAGGPAPIATLRSTPTVAPSGFIPSSGSDSGLRTTPGRDSGIPSSGFFNKDERAPDTPDPGPGVPSEAD